jgi:hypothetical protein
VSNGNLPTRAVDQFLLHPGGHPGRGQDHGSECEQGDGLTQ